MGSNANAFKCILNTFQKYLHFRYSNEKYFIKNNILKYIFLVKNHYFVDPYVYLYKKLSLKCDMQDNIYYFQFYKCKNYSLVQIAVDLFILKRKKG